MTSNSMNYLKKARELFVGEIADATDKMREYRDGRSAALFQALCNLICHAHVVSFAEGYSKKAAREFMDGVANECGLSEKQAFKYTSAITAALALRATKGSFRGSGIDGLDVAASDGPAAVADHLKKFEIETYNQFIAYLRVAVSPVAKVAAQLAKLNEDQRKEAMAMAAKMVKPVADK